MTVKLYTVYRIELNNKNYIGYTSQPLIKRIKQHIYDSIKSNRPKTYFWKAIKKHDPENMKISILDTDTDIESAIKKEVMYIAAFESKNPNKGYNIISGDSRKDYKLYDKTYRASDGYRTKRSWASKGNRNSRYIDKTDDEIITLAITYFKQNGNLFIKDWQKYCVCHKIPVTYITNTKSCFRFNGNGVQGFRRQLIQKLRTEGINPAVEQLINVKNSNKDSIEKVRSLL